MGQQRHDLVAEAVAGCCFRLIVGGVFQPRDAGGLEVGADLRSSTVEQRATQLDFGGIEIGQRSGSGHAGKAVHARSAEDAQQNGFGLVVGVMSG